MLIRFINIFLLITLFLPKFKNTSIFPTFSPNDEINSSFNLEIDNIKESEVLLLNSEISESLIRYLETIRDTPDILIFLPEDTPRQIIKSILQPLFFSNEEFDFIDTILDDLVENVENIYPLIEVIQNNNTIIDCIIEIININENDQLTSENKTNKTVTILQNLLQYNIDLFDFIYDFTEIYPDLFYIFRCFRKSLNDSEIDIDPFVKFIQQNKFELYNFFKEILQNFGNSKKSFEAFSNFVKNNMKVEIEFLKVLRNNTKLFSYILPIFISDELVLEIMTPIYSNNSYLGEFLDVFINNSTLIEEFAELVKKLNSEESTFLKITNFIVQNKNLTSILVNLLKIFINSNLETSKPADFIGKVLRQILVIYTNQNKIIFEEKMSEECISFLNYTFLGNVNDEYSKQLDNEKYDKNISNHYLFKFFLDTTKDKNDLLTYENCISNPTKNDVKNSNLNYMDHIPTFIVSIVDLTNKKTLKKNNTYFNKNHFIIGTCLPQGKNTAKNKIILKNKTESYYHCNKDDYKYMMEKFINIFFDIENINLELLEINNDNKNKNFSFANLIPFFILLIPVLISFILYIYRTIKLIKTNKNNLNNNENEEIKNGEINNSVNLVNKNNEKKIINYPKWYKILRLFFNLKANIKELFSYDSNEMNKININDKGITYIKGIIGFSTIFTILGQLYLIFFNLPMKEFGFYQFHELISNIAYVLIIIGLRYSPRVIFSCSGYTLTYKYLSFIDRESGYYLIKFFFCQFYKYIILVLFILFLRYSLYEIICFNSEIRPMWEIFNNQELLKTNEFWLNLFNLGFIVDIIQIFKENDNLKNAHDLFDYYWMPFNEIFFFVFGILLISLGYKTKIRIDYIIIILIIILIATKIFFYCFYYKNNDEVYTTLYYYIFDYGRLMLNPIFNLDYFLIGMYFGLINYSLHYDINTNANQSKISEEKNILFELKPFSSIGIDDENDYNVKKTQTSDDVTSTKRLEIFTEKEDNAQKDDLNENIRYTIKDININHINKNNPMKSNHVKELEEMSFLMSTIPIIEWHRKDNLKCMFIIIMFFLFLFIIIISLINFISISIFSDKIKNNAENEDYNENDKINETLLLEGFISNPFLNFIFLFDIELFVILIHWLIFILYMRGQAFFINFFSHIYWSFFTKSYFSFLMVCNPVILFFFYESETVIKLNFLNICLYFFINLVFILLVTMLVYVLIELPFKNISKYLVRRDKYTLNLEEDKDDEDDDDEDEENSEKNNEENNKENKADEEEKENLKN